MVIDSIIVMVIVVKHSSFAETHHVDIILLTNPQTSDVFQRWFSMPTVKKFIQSMIDKQARYIQGNTLLANKEIN